MRLAKINGLYIIWYELIPQILGQMHNNLTVSIPLGTLTVFSLFIGFLFIKARFGECFTTFVVLLTLARLLLELLLLAKPLFTLLGATKFLPKPVPLVICESVNFETLLS